MLATMGSPVPASELMKGVRIEALGKTGGDAANAIILHTGNNPFLNVMISMAIANNHIETTGHQRRGRGSRSVGGALYDVYTVQGPEGLYELWIGFGTEEES